MNEYPEHEKLDKIKNQSQAIGRFLDALFEKYTLCEWSDGMSSRDPRNELGVPVPQGYYPVRQTIESLLEQYFGIDHKKLMNEKEKMLDEFRKLNS